MVSRDVAVQDAYESELPSVLAMVAAIWQLAFLVQVLGYLREYREPAVPVAVWLGLAVAALWLVPRTRGGGLAGREAASAVAVAVAAVSLCGWAAAVPGAAGSVDWSVFATGWLLALVAVSRPAWEWVCGALLVFGANAVFSAQLVFPGHLPRTTALGLTRLTASAYALAVILTIFAAIRPTLRAQAGIAVRRAALTSRSAAERAAVAAIREDRRDRLALLEMEVLPLLRGIADGTLDPADARLRERCARHAATLRRSLAGRARTAGGGALPGLEVVLRAASARGLLVDVQVLGDPGDPVPGVPAATLAVVDGVIGALPPHQVMLTVLAAADDVELYVVFSESPRTALDLDWAGRDVPAAARWRAVVNVDEAGAGWLEVCWRKAAARQGGDARTGAWLRPAE